MGPQTLIILIIQAPKVIMALGLGCRVFGVSALRFTSPAFVGFVGISSFRFVVSWGLQGSMPRWLEVPE